MIGTLSRKLRVRDDGTGKGREIDGTFAEFESEDAIILLGDPGMGKTTFLRVAAKANYTTVRKFLIEPHAVVGEALFLDALDEYRTIASGQDASSEVAKALCSLKKPKFRLSCRAADWFGSTDQEVLRVASASGRVVVLELCPLSRDEILVAVQGIVQNPPGFLDEAESAGLGTLLGNPQTLVLLAKAWGSDKKPRNKFEAYEIGVSELIKEPNPQNIMRGATPDPGNLRKAAGAAASTLLLSNSVGISRAEPADDIGYVRLSIVPYPDRDNIDAVLKRRLFISPVVDRFEPTHRTIAEFLAAEDLAARITNDLPIDRVLALLCGIDGKPISSLRGLFAWLMCKVGYLAEDYVERDPYGVVTYGDASVLSPKAQCAIWAGLQQLRDPWFLTNEDDRGSFRDLANPNTAKIILELLKAPTTGIHLKIAVLEAIANSRESTGLDVFVREMVLEKHNNTWLRSTAMRAFAKAVESDWIRLATLDYELAQATDDTDVPEVRVTLLQLTKSEGFLPVRLLSIMEQAASAKKEENIVGRYYILIDLPSDSDLDQLLDGASRILTHKNEVRYELRSLFDQWLQRRLENTSPIMPIQLSSWLQGVFFSSERHSDKLLSALKERFEQNPTLFEEVFELLAQNIPNKKRSFRSFVAYYLWQLMPAKVWPVSHCEFFLGRADKEIDPERASELFLSYMSWLPKEGSNVAVVETGFDFLGRRQDVGKVLGSWNLCKIEEWHIDQSKRQEKENKNKLENRAKNIAHLSTRLSTLREGSEEGILAWAAGVYLGLFYDIGDIAGPRERLVRVTNDEIADACFEGFMMYAENPTIPKKDAVIASWNESKIPYAHELLSLSVFLRINAGMTVPIEALPHCIAVVVTGFSAGDKVPDYDATLSKWLLQQAHQNPSIVRSVLKEMWVSVVQSKKGNLPAFYDLRKDPDSQEFLASLSADVLKSGINEDKEIVAKLVSVLLIHDQQAALEIGAGALDRNESSVEVRAIWSTALFVIDPSTYLVPWKTLISGSNDAVWEAIEVIRGDRHEKSGAISLSPTQRAEIITVVGQRFASVGRPPATWSGNQNPWDASDFVSYQVKLLAADGSADVGAQLERLENNGGLESYHDVIRHHRAQYEKQQRESTFTFASPEQVAEAIQNHAPATASDLLVFVCDHLGVLAHEIGRTQRERYRAYWNESGRNLSEPKREEICSGLLAEDLQNRVQAQGLIVTVEHHMIADKECDVMVLQGTERLLPIEVKHHFNADLWTAWRTQLDRLYTRDAKAGGLGIYLVLWSGEAKGRMMPKLPDGIKRPTSATELRSALESLIPESDRHRLRIVVLDISGQ